jgi:hypothetical protein
MSTRLSYWFACLSGTDDLAIAAVVDELEEQDVCHTVLLRRTQGQWDTQSLNNRSINIHSVGAQGEVIVPCFEGSLAWVKGAQAHWGVVGQGKEMPSTLRRLTCSRLIGSHLYVAGMQRQVFRFDLPAGGWSRFDDGCVVPRSSQDIAGFNAIDGDEAGALCAVGYGGEIWWHNGVTWHPCDSPTNVKLIALRHVGQGHFYAGGAKGLLLSGRGDKWGIIDHGVTEQTFVHAEVHEGLLYLTTDRGGLYCLDADGQLNKVALPEEGTAHWLHAHGPRLLALGYRQAYIFTAATGWVRQALPRLGS